MLGRDLSDLSDKQTRFDSSFTEAQKAQMSAIKDKFGVSKLTVTYGPPVHEGYIVKGYQPHRGTK